jgi:hypothetical protein
MAPFPDRRGPLEDFLLDEESLLLFEKSNTSYAADSNSTSPTGDSASVLTLGEDEDDDDDFSSSFWWNLWQKYYHALEDRPLVVKSITALILLGLADVIAQSIEIIREIHQEDPSSSSINWNRVARFGFFGLAGAPWTHYYYAWLDRVLPPTREPWTWTTFSKFTYQFQANEGISQEEASNSRISLGC